MPSNDLEQVNNNEGGLESPPSNNDITVSVDNSEIVSKLEQIINEILADRETRNKEKQELNKREQEQGELEKAQEEENLKIEEEEKLEKEEFLNDIRTIASNTDLEVQQTTTELMIERLDEQILVGKVQITFFTVLMCILLVKMFASTFKR